MKTPNTETLQNPEPDITNIYDDSSLSIQPEAQTASIRDATEKSINHILSNKSDELDQRYKRNLGLVLNLFSDKPLEQIHIGPSFEISSPRGILTAETAYFRENKEKPQISKEIYLIFVRDEQNKIIAYREFTLWDDDEREENMVKGEINVGIKKQGLSTQLDLCYMQFLQFLTNHRKKTIFWQVQNENYKNFKKFEIEIRQKYYIYDNSEPIDPDKLDHADREEYLSLRNEQMRWQRVYGNKGRMGITMSNNLVGRKTFHPTDTSYPDIPNIKRIKLVRRKQTENDIFSEITEIEEIGANQEEYIKQKKLDFVSTLKSNQQSIL